jgi:ABC-type bacteriocin/lantibiotic exporter with double-glycine peptidase domain
MRNWIEGSVLFRASKILSRSDRNRFLAVIVLQVLLGAMDLIGVGLIGVMGSLAISGYEGNEPGNRVSWLLNLLHIDSFQIQDQVFILAFIAVSVLISKTVMSMIFIKRILFFLSYRGARLSSSLVSKLLAQPLLQVQSKSNQETLFALTTGVNSIAVGILATFVSLVSDLSLLLVLAIGLFIVDPTLSLTSFVIFGSVAIFLYRYLQVKARNLGAEFRESNIRSNSLILEVFSSYRELVVKNRRFYYATRIGEQRNKLATATAEISFMPNLSKYVLEISIVVGSLIVTAVQFLVNDTSRAIATLTIFFAASMRIAPAILRVHQSSLVIKSNAGMALPTLNLIDELINVDIEKEHQDAANFTHDSFVSKVSMQNVSLRYPGKNVPTIENVSIEITPGEIIALVGPSGAGKTTLVDLMLGIIQPDSGKVVIGGQSPMDAIRSNPGAIGYLPQDVLILDGSVRENILLGYPMKEEYERWLERAVSISQLTQFIRELPSGLDQEIGERGSRISGGQRQRLGIARAVFTAPKLLVLDEATSSLDGETESLIANAVKQFGRQVTVILIAHRLTTVKIADRVVYLDKGQIVAQGSFEEVRNCVPDFDRQIRSLGN